MAINKKLIHFKTKQKFNEELANGNILDSSIVFIKDTNEIYTHGTFYDGSKADLGNIESSIQSIITDVSELNAILVDSDDVADDPAIHDYVTLTHLENKLSTKQDELVNGITIKTINGEDLLGEGNIEIQGGGGGVELLEVKYNWDGTELTDEDKAVNAATYAKVIAGGNCVVWHNIMGVVVYASAIFLPVEDSPDMGIVFESEMLNAMMLSNFIVGIAADGNTFIEMIPTSPNKILYFDISSYTDLLSLLQENGMENDNLGPVFALGYVNDEYLFGVINYIDVLPEMIRMDYISTTGQCKTIYADPADNTITIFSSNYANVFINPGTSGVKANQSLFGKYTTPSNLNTAMIKYGNSYYSPISYKTIEENNAIIAYQITIYKDDAFETWQINADGTTQQITQ